MEGWALNFIRRQGGDVILATTLLETALQQELTWKVALPYCLLKIPAKIGNPSSSLPSFCGDRHPLEDR
jgi:hypothetical protein